ncbi:hypothetical protein ASG22_19850 [Chryseobacterium sp. Leaf405]|uniref:hypothetical protein n=1 Tax=Chryseobacterium sp. Leaf405 TaxID=1736367 RepID=UPI0006F727D0|nr:hypothetical protein [Chryseobacterium sp. Leaf405]KQT29579.1 hypothetical protein ASG22_19850 [Chryseobacterium sp. Leaf405]
MSSIIVLNYVSGATASLCTPEFKRKNNAGRYSRAAFVCQHLNLEQYKGFGEAFDTYRGMQLDEDDDFQAWCSECEKVRLQSNGWNDESEEFAKIKLICEDCYFELKSLNTK